MTYINHDLAYIRLNKYKGMPFTRKQEPSRGDAYNTQNYILRLSSALYYINHIIKYPYVFTSVVPIKIYTNLMNYFPPLTFYAELFEAYTVTERLYFNNLLACF